MLQVALALAVCMRTCVRAFVHAHLHSQRREVGAARNRPPAASFPARNITTAFAQAHARVLPGELEADQGVVLVISPAQTRAGSSTFQCRLAYGAIRHRAGLGRSGVSRIQTRKLRWVAPLLSNALTLLPARGHFTRSRIQLDCHCRRVLGTALSHKRRIKGLPGHLRYFVQASRIKHHVICADAPVARWARVSPLCSHGDLS